MAGCRSPAIRAAAEARVVPPPALKLSAERAAMAEALAHFSQGLLRERLADGSALASYRRALEKKPDYDVLYVRTALLNIKQGRSDEAVALMEEACRKNPRSVEACLYLAQIYQALNRPAEAVKAARRAIRIEPADARGYIQLAVLYLAVRDEESARATLEKARSKAADKLPVLRLLGDIHAQKIAEAPAAPSAAAARAIACYEEAAGLAPDDASLQYQERLGDLYLINRQTDKALAVFQDLTTRLPDSIQLQKKIAMCYMTLGRKEKAVEALKAVLGREPENSQLQFYLGELYETLGNTNAAVASFRSAADTNPSAASPYLKLAVYYMKDAPEKAGQALNDGLARFPEDKQLLDMLSQYYLRSQQPLKALNSFIHLQNLLLRDNDRLPDAGFYVVFGEIAQRARLNDLAAALYETALELAPGLLEARIRLAFLHMGARDVDEALNEMSEAVFLRPEDPAAWYYLGLLSGQTEAFPAAIAAFERVETLARRLPRAGLLMDTEFYFNYGAVCERAGQFERAEELLQKAIRLDTGNAEAFNYLAYMWAEKGVNLDLALEYSRHSLDCDPDNGAFLDTLGWVLYKQKEFAEALACLQAAYYFVPDDPTIMEHLGDVWFALRNRTQAADWWQRSYQANPNNKTLEEKMRKHGVKSKPPRLNAPAN